MYRELLRFSAPLAVMSVGTLVVSGIGIDTFMIAFFSNADLAAEYNVIMNTAKLMILVISSLAFLFMPIVSELHAKGATEEMERLYQLATKWIVLASLPILAVMVAFPTQFIGLTFGDQYTPAAFSLTVLGIGFFVHSSLGLSERLLKSVGSTTIVMYDTLVAGAVNVVLNLLLIPQFPVLGATIGTAGAYIVLDLLFVYHAYQREAMHPFTASLLKPAAVGSAVLGLGAVGAIYLTDVTQLRLVLWCALLGPVYLLVMIRAGAIESEEVDLLLGVEDRFDVDLGPLKRIGVRLMGK
jgi:O-antigen/teichoic acid export membrane protein